ncbi:MAG: hypothetical protein J5I57_13675 [Melioribacteraceae bacterium]|nr:hypothetical protein [Melioribacteraceae bacterium]
MNLEKLQNLDKLYFTADDIAKELKIGKKSAQVTASRFVSRGNIIRLKRDIFILPQRFNTAEEEELFTIGNILQTPSYISLTSALSYYNLSTQQVRNYVESIGLKRTITFPVNNVQFNFSKVKKEFYIGFEKNENFFIATPAKALADCIYLTSIGLYNADFDAMDLSKFDKNEINELLIKTNKAAKNLWQKLIKNYEL